MKLHLTQSQPKAGEAVGKTVVSTKEVKTSKYVVRSFHAHRFGEWQLPNDFFFVAGLPHSSAGIFLKSEQRRNMKTGIGPRLRLRSDFHALSRRYRS
jgi:hypothetical protein